MPADVVALRARIEDWRTRREKRRAMPEDLWSAAVSAARKHGLWSVSRALRLNYESLKKRLVRSAATLEGQGIGGSGFVEMQGVLLGSGERSEAVVELTAADGARLTVRVSGPEQVDIRALADAFWSRVR